MAITDDGDVPPRMMIRGRTRAGGFGGVAVNPERRGLRRGQQCRCLLVPSSS
jgi:hypothetical protein